MSTRITEKTWPLDSEGRFDFTPIETRAAHPGSLDQLTDWGISFQHVCTEVSDEPVAALVTEGDLELLYQQLVLSFPEHGLWPVLTEGLHGDIERPWLSRELDAPEEVEGGVDKLLDRRNRENAEMHEELPPESQISPATQLADPTTGGTVHELVPAGITGHQVLLITPVVRPADVPAAVGRTGPMNYGISGGEVSAMLRSWEDRFGAVLMHLDFASITLQVSAPPSDPEQVKLVALEHYAFCPDNIDQGSVTLEAYLPGIDSLAWGFWWD